jgi:type IV secretion system protein VirD4
MGEDNNFGRIIRGIKHYYHANKKRMITQITIITIIVTILTGQAGESVAVFAGTLEKSTLNPFVLIYYAWIKLFPVTFLIISIINIILIIIITNMDDKFYDKERNFQISKNGTLGTGGFMQREDKEEALIMDDVENIDGMILGKDLENDLVCTPKNTLYLNGHKCVCGGSGARKTTTQALNDLLQIIKRGESFIATDPKGEIYATLAVMAEKRGYTTRVLNLVNLKNSDGIDFIKCIRDKYEDRDEEFKNVMTLTEVIMSNTTKEGDAGFWVDCQRGLLSAAILYVMYDETGNTEPTLASAYDLILKNDKTELDRIFNKIDNSHPAKAQYMVYAKTEDKIRTSVVIGLTMRLQIFMTESVKRIISEDEIDLTLPGKKKCAYFIVMSDQESTFDFIASLFFSIFFIKMVGHADSSKQRRLDVPVNLIMDEFPSIGTLPDFSRKLATLRSRGIYITIIFQNYGQIMDKYDKHEWQTIISNCDTNTYLGGNDSEETARFYENRLGDMTVVTTGKRTTNKLMSLTNNRFKPNYAESESESTRPVMTKDELLRLPLDHAIVFLKSCRAVKVKKFVYTEHPFTKEIIDRNATAHIPTWRRVADGYPEADVITDEELEPLVIKMSEDGNIVKYLRLHRNNRKYKLMDFLHEYDREEFEKFRDIMQERCKDKFEDDESVIPEGYISEPDYPATESKYIKESAPSDSNTNNTLSNNQSKNGIKRYGLKPDSSPREVIHESRTLNENDDPYKPQVTQSTGGIKRFQKINKDDAFQEDENLGKSKMDDILRKNEVAIKKMDEERISKKAVQNTSIPIFQGNKHMATPAAIPPSNNGDITKVLLNVSHETFDNANIPAEYPIAAIDNVSVGLNIPNKQNANKNDFNALSQNEYEFPAANEIPFVSTSKLSTEQAEREDIENAPEVVQADIDNEDFNPETFSFRLPEAKGEEPLEDEMSLYMFGDGDPEIATNELTDDDIGTESLISSDKELQSENIAMSEKKIRDLPYVALERGEYTEGNESKTDLSQPPVYDGLSSKEEPMPPIYENISKNDFAVFSDTEIPSPLNNRNTAARPNIGMKRKADTKKKGFVKGKPNDF